MTTEKRITNFQDFWPYYLSEHRQLGCRVLHYFGTISANLLLVTFIIFQQWAYIPFALVIGYGPAWIGHFFIEKNRPATFDYPLWSFLADYKMLALAITGKLTAQLNALPDRLKN